jgi:hypothetical protein
MFSFPKKGFSLVREKGKSKPKTDDFIGATPSAFIDASSSPRTPYIPSVFTLDALRSRIDRLREVIIGRHFFQN